jgi:hypothetical protein
LGSKGSKRMKIQEAQENFDRFIKTINSQLVELADTSDEEPLDYRMFKFEARLKEDKYISKNSMFNLSDEYFADIDKYGELFMKCRPGLNNTGRTGWFVVDIEK